MRSGVRHQLLRLTKEVLHNVVKRARATEVGFQLRCDPAGLCWSIADNGVGFDPVVSADVGNGLASMRRRAAALGGRLSVDSRPGQGTRIVAVLPLDL